MYFFCHYIVQEYSGGRLRAYFVLWSPPIDQSERNMHATIFMILDNAYKSMFLYKKFNLNRLPKTRKCCLSLTFLWHHCIGIDTYSKILQYTLFLHFGLMVLYIFWLTINKWKTKNLNLKNRLHFKSELSTQL